MQMVNQGVRQDLQEADLKGANFNGVDLRNVNLAGANLEKGEKRQFTRTEVGGGKFTTDEIERC